MSAGPMRTTYPSFCRATCTSRPWSTPAVRSGLSAHEAVCAAIVGRDEEGAARAMLQHLQESKARLSSALVFPRRAGSTGASGVDGEESEPHTAVPEMDRPVMIGA